MEQPLPKHGACALCSVNLSEFVTDPFTENAAFDLKGFRETTRAAVRSMNRVIDEGMGRHALPEQRAIAERYRNIGVGVMGLYDAMAKLGMRYGGEESVTWADNVMNDMFRTAFMESVELAKVHGPFPGYRKEILDSPFVKAHFTKKELKEIGAVKYGLRNGSLLSIAPAGSIGTMLNCSTGAEPAFAVSYKRRTVSLGGGKDEEYDVFTGVAKEYVDAHPGEKLPAHFVVAGDIPWKEKVDMQAALQKHVDTGISSTVNLKEEVTPEEIEKLYLYAWEKGCKGITIFRDNCKRLGILTKDAKDNADPDDGAKKSAPEGEAPKAEIPEEVAKETEEILSEAKRLNLERGEVLHLNERDVIGLKRKIRSGCGNIHVNALFSMRTGELYEVFFDKGSEGGCLSFMVGLSRVVSRAIRTGMSFEDAVGQLHDTVACPAYARRSVKFGDTSKGSSCPNAIGYALVDMREQALEMLGLKGGKAPEFKAPSERPATKPAAPAEKAVKKIRQAEEHSDRCPDCGGTELQFTGGCVSCPACGWTRCN